MMRDGGVHAIGRVLGVLLLAGAASASAATPYQQPASPPQGPPQWSVQSAPAVFAPVMVANQGFETGDFTGWSLADELGGSGSWFVYSGTIAPFSGLTIFPPPQGIFAATSDQRGPGSHILFQDIAVPAMPPSSVTFVIYYVNYAGVFFTPPTLDALSSGPNQQFRVDIMDPAAFVASVAPADVLLNVFQTNVGDPTSMAPRLMTVDLSPFAGQTVRLRFAEVDNLSNFETGVDDGIARSKAPALSPSGLAAVVVLLLLVGGWRLAHRDVRI